MFITRNDNSISTYIGIIDDETLICNCFVRESSHLFQFVKMLMAKGKVERAIRSDREGGVYGGVKSISVCSYITNKKLKEKVRKVRDIIYYSLRTGELRGWRCDANLFKYFIYVRKHNRDEGKETNDVAVYKRMMDDDMLEEYVSMIRILKIAKPNGETSY
jgi:hypothetical protein